MQGESIEMPKKQATVGGPLRSRSIPFGPQRPQASTFASNEVTTAKYTKWNFIPKSIYEQFRRVANIYFLIISLLQISTDLSPTNKYATIAPLFLVLAVTIFKELIEDIQRHKADDVVNSSRTLVLRGADFVEIAWAEVTVGDIVCVYNKQSVPADLIILSSSDEHGVVYIETSGLDGENNLKFRHAPHSSIPSLQPGSFDASKANAASLSGTVRSEEPNADLYSFRASMILQDHADSPVDLRLINTVWRGSILRNTKWMMGMVIYSGQDSKLIQNSSAAPSKRSHVDKQVNQAIIIIFLTLVVLCTASTILGALWQQNQKSAWYIFLGVNQTTMQTVTAWITFLILYNNLVPISLYVTLEIVKSIQGRMIQWDSQMYSEEQDTPALARTSNLNEDLGQIEYIFSDKTGTLTCNQMRFKKCSIAGVVYGGPVADRVTSTGGIQIQPVLMGDTPTDLPGQLNSAESESKLTKFVSNRFGVTGGASAPVESVAQSINSEELAQHYDFNESNLLQTIRSEPESEQARKIIDFLLVMGTCHTVIPEKDDMGAIQYQAASPDEETLVVAARRLGVEFLSRSKKQVRFRVFGQVMDFEILNVNEFSSDRKRMSVVIRHPNGSLFLYAKGADDVIFNRLRDADKGLAEQTREHLSEFGSSGLRTLAMAQRKIDADVYAKWSDDYQKAANLLEDRDSQLHELAEQIESNLELLGASAIEDRLQDGVPDTICSLIDAGIKIWMLTGDKLETAINIGVSCQLLSSTTDLLRIDEDTFYQTSVKIANYLQNYQQNFGKKSDNMALIVSGASLHHILSDSNLSRVFLEICQSCRSVIACRLNPTQKASLVQLVKSASGEPLTLSVGDGANDVSMLQTAHIGVGIVGSEGMQAVRAADYALGQFRFLKRLLLVHGRWNHKRVSNLILYSFYKNITVVLSLFYFCFSNGFSGTTLYESWLGAGWNVGWTLVPIMLYGFLDQDLRAVTVLRNPEIYMGGQRKSEFSLWKMVQWQSNAVLHSIIIFVICQPATSSIYAPDGKNAGLILTGTIINCVTMLTVNLKMALHTNSWTSWNAIGIAGSILIWFAFTALYSSMIVGSQYDFYGIAKRLFVQPIFWLLITTVPLIACIVDICVLYVQRAFYPSPIDIAQELDANARESEKNSLLPTTSHVVLDGGEVVPTFSREVFDAEVTAENAAKSSETLISDHRAAAVSYHLSRLQAILSGNKGAASQKKEMLSQVLHLSQEVGMHWLTLSFQSGAEGGGELKNEDIESLEHEFQNQYVKKNLTFLRSAAAVIFVLMLCYSVFVTLSGGDSQLLARWIVTAAALVVMFFMWTRLFRAYFSEFLFIMMIVGGIGKTLMITSNGVSGLALYAIIVFLVLRSRFFTSLVAALVDLAFYDLYMGLQNIITGPQLGFIDFLQVCLVAFAALHGYRMERSYRVDFLLQKDYVSERARTQKIVDNMLPTYVTKKMKLNRGKNAVIANSGESVSIIFCDVIGFAHLSNIYSPQVLVSILDAVYSMFDELCEKHCVQKMETVGKTYMACAGLQGTRKDHALAAAEMAQEMIALAHSCVDLNGDVLEIRVGINTGRIISGVVGELRPQFSLFGDTVNTSSRMQSTGVVNRVHVSEATASLLKQDYRMEARQTPVKGKGILNTFLLDERTSNPMRSRRRSIVKLEDDMIDEIPKYVQKLALRELDHIDESESVEMNQFTLAFPIVEHDDGEMIDYEAIYLEKRAERIDTEVRVPIVLAIIFFIVEALLEWQFSQDNLVSIFIIRFAFVGLAVLFLGLLALERFRLHFASNARFYTTLLFLAAVVSTLLSRLSYDASFSDNFLRPALTIIFLTTLACNSGIRFIDAVVFNIITVVIFCVAGFGFAINDSRSTMLLLVFWVVAGSVINLVSSYGRETYQRREFVLNYRVFKEKEVADKFLYKMIPNTVAETMKAGRKALAETFENVTILYSDIQGFTSYAASSNPENVVKLLSSLFTEFDKLTKELNVYKIQTIGDAYVLVSGLPFCTPGQWTPADSAISCMKMACAMIKVIEGVRTAEGTRVRMRIGLHTGKLIAGCIGTKTLRYDIWGNDCQCANTMESSGLPSCVVISEATKQLVADKFECHKFELVPVKGVGDVQTYCVTASPDGKEEFKRYEAQPQKKSGSH